jgi:asparagine synthase (glutamine-hydrolysing)
MSMAHSIEARVPLLDHKLIEFAATIPPELKLRRGEGKYIFKRALRGRLPAPVLQRPKRGFAIPLGRWFRGRLGDFVRDLLLSPRARQRGVVNPAYVEKLLRRNERGRELDFQIWTLISFELWARRFLDGTARPSARPALAGEPLVVGPAAAVEAMGA